MGCRPNCWIRTGGILAALAVAMGAFAAHGLSSRFVEWYANQEREVNGKMVPVADRYLDVFETAAEYQMSHALGVILTGILMQAAGPSRCLKVAGWSFTLGIVLFSGSLYLMTMTDQVWLGMVTPFGGTLFLVGWVALATGGLCRASPVDPAAEPSAESA